MNSASELPSGRVGPSLSVQPDAPKVTYLQQGAFQLQDGSTHYATKLEVQGKEVWATGRGELSPSQQELVIALIQQAYTSVQKEIEEKKWSSMTITAQPAQQESDVVFKYPDPSAPLDPQKTIEKKHKFQFAPQEYQTFQHLFQAATEAGSVESKRSSARRSSDQQPVSDSSQASNSLTRPGGPVHFDSNPTTARVISLEMDSRPRSPSNLAPREVQVESKQSNSAVRQPVMPVPLANRRVLQATPNRQSPFRAVREFFGRLTLNDLRDDYLAKEAELKKLRKEISASLATDDWYDGVRDDGTDEILTVKSAIKEIKESFEGGMDREYITKMGGLVAGAPYFRFPAAGQVKKLTDLARKLTNHDEIENDLKTIKENRNLLRKPIFRKIALLQEKYNEIEKNRGKLLNTLNSLNSERFKDLANNEKELAKLKPGNKRQKALVLQNQLILIGLKATKVKNEIIALRKLFSANVNEIRNLKNHSQAAKILREGATTSFPAGSFDYLNE